MRKFLIPIILLGLQACVSSFNYVNVSNVCAPYTTVVVTGGRGDSLLVNLPYGQSRAVLVEGDLGATRYYGTEVFLRADVWLGKKFIGTETKSFYVYPAEQTRQQGWDVYPSNCSNIRQQMIQKSLY